MAKHYIRLDGQFLIKTFTTDFEQPIDGDICVNEDGDRHFNLNLYTIDGFPALKWLNSEIIPTTNEDLQALRDAVVVEPALEERVGVTEMELDKTKLALLEIGGVII